MQSTRKAWIGGLGAAAVVGVLALAPAGHASATPLAGDFSTLPPITTVQPPFTCITQSISGTVTPGPAYQVPIGDDSYYNVVPQLPHWNVVAAGGRQGAPIDVGLYGSPPSACNMLRLSMDPVL